MTSVDDLFKVYKSAKLSSNGDSSRHARVEDEQNDDDMEAGPAPPPGDGEDDDYGPELPPDDEDGRFFGTGMTKQQTEIMDFVDARDDEAAPPPDKIDAAWMRKTALSFEKTISKNAELRARFEREPQKFIASEADLDTAIKELSILSDHADLWAEFVRVGSVASLVSLLAHENTDIAIAAIEIINELTDEDVAAEDDQWNPLVDAMLDADLSGLIVSNLNRLDEADETDRAGVYHALSVIENVLSRKSIAEKVGQDEALLRWLLARAQRKESPVSQNKQYAAELLAIIAQTSPATRRKLVSLDAVDAALQLVASYRKRDPEKGGEEEEYMQDLFEMLTSLADEPEGKAKFVEAEGVELCLIMLKEGHMSKPAALRLLDHAAGAPAGAEVCAKIVEAGGLKTTFTMFMKRPDGPTLEHLLGIFASLLRLLPAESAGRIRTLAKFVEKDYEKTARLVTLRREYAARVGVAEARIAEERAAADDEEERAAMADEWFSQRLEAGLFSLQTIDVVLSWLVAEDGGARRRILTLLGERDEDLSVVRASLTEQLEGLDGEREENKDGRDMLTALLECLR
ncbi:Catenin-beta-like protein [Plectosphaerella plurivora]|uniref:Catenin-beta-like protein n=1 Tax=Plectosphaerella plurivora TaxID=936078 RepID=A0A9P9AEM3_9PEZI|nr:Catenin-beta-like protein [Plectosphaerella plurivora]